MRVGEICAGVGGLSLAMKSLGHEMAWHSEVAAHACGVLERRFHGVRNVGDIRQAVGRLPKVELLAGGIPCTPHSAAGKRLASEDDRDLWPTFVAALDSWAPRDRPEVCVVENVAGLISSEGGAFLLRMFNDFHARGYAVEWDHCPALATGAPHRRDRIWIVARRDGLLTWEVDEAPSMFDGLWGSIPRAGRWDGRLHARTPRWPVPQVEAAWRDRWAHANPWPSPDASVSSRTNRSPSDGAAVRPLLTSAVRWHPWPTSRSGEAKQGDASPAKRIDAGSEDRMLSDAVRMQPWATPHPVLQLEGEVRADPWATPSARDWKAGDASAETIGGNARPLNEQVKVVTLPDGKQVAILPGALNPAWVEALCGLPHGWTDLSCEKPEAFPGWPMPRATLDDGTELWGASPQWAWEPERRVIGRDPQRRHRLTELGNLAVPACAALALSGGRTIDASARVASEVSA